MTFDGYLGYAERLTNFFGRDKVVSELGPDDFASLRADLSKPKAGIPVPVLRGGGVALVRCANCAVDYLSCESSRAPPTCPYCALYARLGIGRQATGRRAWRAPKC